jgi:hypothetical protein
MFALFLIALTVLFTVVAINDGNFAYIIGAILSAVVSYLIIKKKI